MFRVIFIFVLSISTALADDNKYWNIKIPVMTGATNITHERNNRFFIISAAYDLTIRNADEIYNFYNHFFEKMTWENLTKNSTHMEKESQGKWNSHRVVFTQKGTPEISYAAIWNAKTIPAMTSVNVKILKYRDGIFYAKVKVLLSPVVDTSYLFELQKHIMKDPRNIFILYQATGGNPFEIDKVNSRPNEKYKNVDIVKKYYKLIDEVIGQYQSFGKKYVQ